MYSSHYHFDRFTIKYYRSLISFLIWLQRWGFWVWGNKRLSNRRFQSVIRRHPRNGSRRLAESAFYPSPGFVHCSFGLWGWRGIRRRELSVMGRMSLLPERNLLRGVSRRTGWSLCVGLRSLNRDRVFRIDLSCWTESRKGRDCPSEHVRVTSSDSHNPRQCLKLCKVNWIPGLLG